MDLIVSGSAEGEWALIVSVDEKNVRPRAIGLYRLCPSRWGGEQAYGDKEKQTSVYQETVPSFPN
jgi:hypothetical protein